jgi:alcohol dehydrogenase class IV
MTEFYEPLRAFELLLPGRVIFGIGAVARVGHEARRLNAHRALIATDSGVSRAGLVDRVREPLLKEGLAIEVWDHIEPEPSVTDVEDLLNYCKPKNLI